MSRRQNAGRPFRWTAINRRIETFIQAGVHKKAYKEKCYQKRISFYLYVENVTTRKWIFSRTSASVHTSHSAAFWEASGQLSGKLLRHTLLGHLHVKNVLGMDIQDDLASVFSFFVLKLNNLLVYPINSNSALWTLFWDHISNLKYACRLNWSRMTFHFIAESPLKFAGLHNSSSPNFLYTRKLKTHRSNSLQNNNIEDACTLPNISWSLQVYFPVELHGIL